VLGKPLTDSHVTNPIKGWFFRVSAIRRVSRTESARSVVCLPQIGAEVIATSAI